MTVIGIDPGVTGAIAIRMPHETRILDMPTYEVKRGKRQVREVNAAQLARDLEGAVGSVEFFDRAGVHAYVERVGAMPGQGVASMFAFGKSVGIVEGILAALEIPYTLVAASVWTRAVGVNGGKDGARKRAAELFPSQTGWFTRSKDDGRADAMLIAFYGEGQQGV